jgi:hypothetical protein
MPLFRLQSPFPFPLQVRVLGDGPLFPMIVNTPSPLGSVPIPYPDLSMRMQVRLPHGQWSPEFSLQWKPGAITVPRF